MNYNIFNKLSKNNCQNTNLSKNDVLSNLTDGLLEKNNNFSLGKIILIFYTLVASSAIFPLLSKQLKTKLENDRLAQHLLAVFALLSLVILVSNGNFSIQRIFGYTIICYLWFILSTKMDLHVNIIMMGSLLTFILYQNFHLNEKQKISEDENLDKKQKTLLLKTKKSKDLYITLGLILITLVGTVLYSNKKETQYGGGYNLMDYLIY